MRRTAFFIGLTALLAGPAFAGPLGVADSAGAFQIERDGEALSSRLGSATVRDGDRITSQDEQVKLEGQQTAVVLLAQRSSVDVNEDELVLGRGALAMHPKAGQASPSVVVDELAIRPGSEGEAAPKLIAVERMGADRVRVRSVGGSYSVTDSTTGQSVVHSSPAGTVQEFQRRDGVWNVNGDGATTSLDGGVTRGGSSDLQAVAYFDFPGDDDLEVSTSGEDIGGRTVLGQHGPPRENVDWIPSGRGGRP